MSEIIGSPKILKQVNTKLIIDALAANPKATRVELASYVGLSQPTVNAIIGSLLKHGVIEALGYAASSGGRRAQTYRLNPNHSHVVILWVTGTDLNYCLINAGGDALKKGQSKLVQTEDALEQAYSILDQLFSNDFNIKAISISVPGAVSLSGTVFAIPQLPEWEELPLQALLQERYGVPATVHNDMNVVAYGYYLLNLQESREDLALIHIGKGIGAGIIVNGSIIKGFSSFAGEISYMYTGTVPGASQGRGPFEIQYQNATTPQEQAEVIGRMLVNIICTINPAVVAFSGSGISKELLADIRRWCEKCLPAFALPNMQTVKDESVYYTAGLSKLAQSLFENDVKLVIGG